MPTLDEHDFGAFVVEAAFLGDVAVLALGDGTVRRLAPGGATEAAAVHKGAILAAAPTEDRRFLLTAGDDGRVARVAADGAATVLAERPKKWIDHVAAGPSGVVAYASGRQAFVRFADGRERVYDLPRQAGGLAFAPKGLRLAISRYDAVGLYWPNADAPPTDLLWKGAHLGVSFSPDGRNLVSSMQENALHGWRLDDGKDMRMSGYPSKPRSLSWSAKGRFLATSGANAAILWPFHHKDGPMGKPPLQLGAREKLVTCVACHPREEIVAIGFEDGMIMAARFADANEALLRRPGGGRVSALAFDRTGLRLVFGGEDGGGGLIGLSS